MNIFNATFFIACSMAIGSTMVAAQEAKHPEFVGAKTCAECHPQAYEAWNKSHHSWAMRSPHEKNVLGDFNDASFTHKGDVSRFFKRDGQFMIQSAGRDGKRKDFEVKYSVGVEPLQQYLIEIEKGHLQAFDVAWDTEKKRWFSLFPDQNNKPGDGQHWTGPYKNWQAQCAECHQTQFVKGYAPFTQSYKSSWKELNVSCGSCHGGGEAHVKWARDPDEFSVAQYLDVDAKGLSVSYSQDNPSTEVNICARCHSRREPLSGNSPKPGSLFADNYNLALLRPDLYHADGQIKDEVYVYGSFLQSKMHAKGVRCSNCHEPHSAELKAEGNAVCTQCHNPQGNSNFPSLKRQSYDVPSHHMHQQEGVGAQCVSCHMPAKTFMVVDPRRDHSFRVPRPDLSVKLGTPNACTDCHSDKTAEWAADHTIKWFPKGRTGRPHFAEIFSKANGPETEDEVIQGLVDYATSIENPAIVRATSISKLARTTDPKTFEKVEPLLKSESPLIRQATIPLLRRSAPEQRLQKLVPMLDDPVRSVRILAVRELLNIPPKQFSSAQRRMIARVMQEYQKSLLAKADWPQVQLAIGGIALTGRNYKAAEAAFRQAVAIDPQLSAGWMTIAQIQLAQSRIPAARKTVMQALRSLPQSAPLHRMLGIVSMRLRQPIAAAESFRRASTLAPGDVSLLIELGSAQLQAGVNNSASDTLASALRLDPNNADALYLYAHASLALKNIRRTKELVRQLQKQHPQFELDPQLRPFMAPSTGSGN